MTELASIKTFMAQEKIAVAGVSRKKQKFGNAIFTELEKKGYQLYPVNPNMEEYRGATCYHKLEDLPDEVTALVVSTPETISLELLDEAKRKGISNIWFQQGSLSKAKCEEVRDSGLNIISNRCILMHCEPVKGVHGFHRWISKTFGNFPS